MEKHARGGRRPGVGRKPRYGEATRTMRVPASRMAAVQGFLESGQPPCLPAVQAAVRRWRVLLDKVPGRASQPRWVKAAELLGELEQALKG